MNDPLGLLQPERFHDEPIYCEAPHSPDDVIYSGSEDEAYDCPSDRRKRYEEQALRFLDGKPLFLLSASLRGPFNRKSGWVNPWRSQSGIKKPAKRKRPSRATRSRPTVWTPKESFKSPQSNVAQIENGLTQDTNEDSFVRVQNWRNRVLAELDVNVTAPASSQSTKPTVEQPRKVSFPAPDAFGDTDNASFSSSLSPPPSSLVACENATNQTPEKASDSLEDKDYTLDEAGQSLERHVEPSPTPVTNTPRPLLLADKPELPPSLLPLDTIDLSPRAMKLYEQSFVSSLGQQTESNIEDKQPESPLQRRSNTMRLGETPAATVSLPDQDSSKNSLHRNGSFRYRRPPRRSTRKSLRMSGLTAGNKGQKDRQSHKRQPSTDPVADDMREEAKVGDSVEEKMIVQEEIVVQGKEVIQAEIVVQNDVAVRDEVVDHVDKEDQEEVDIQEEVIIQHEMIVDAEEIVKENAVIEAVELTEEPMLTQSDAMGCPQSQVFVIPQGSQGPSPATCLKTISSDNDRKLSELGQAEDTDVVFPLGRAPSHISQHEDFDASQTPSQIDGITLVAPGSSTSERSSIGNFSAEKASQDEISMALFGFPKRLLWPAKAGLQPQQSSTPAPSAEFSPAPFSLRIRSSGDPPTSSPIPEVLQEVASLASTGLQTLQAVLEQPQPELEESAPDMALKVETSSPPPPPVAVPEPDQSPWITDALPLSSRVVFLSSRDEAGPSPSPQAQSPWARGDSQIVVPEVRRFDPLSSPANSAILPQATAAPPLPPPVPQELQETSSQIILTHPSTPESKNSGLPTPEFTLSVKSLRELSTPSPLPAAKRRRISSGEESESRLPSAQHLVDSTISKPWTALARLRGMQAKSVTSSQRPKKPRKSVRFAPLPGDPIPTTMDPDAATTAFSSPYGAELSTFTTPKNQAINRPCNTFSPPPPILRTEPLPSANEKFGKHFAKVTVKQQIGIRSTPSSSLTPTNITTAPHLLRSQRKAPHLLPSESQQNCASPAVDAMAEAFLTADNIHLSSHSSSIGTDDGTVKIDIEAMVSGRDPDESIIIPHGDDRGRRHAREEEQPPSGVSNSFVMQEEDVVMQEEGVIDDVSAVLENLDDFLGQSWDLDADIARVRADDKMRGGSNSSERASWAGGGMGLDLDLDLETGIGIGMDEEAAAVWDRE